MRSPVRTLLCFCLLASVSCAGSQRMVELENRARMRDEILHLDAKILDYRKDLGLEPRPDPFLIQQIDKHGEAPWTSSAPRTPECQDVCDLAEYICQAKDDICKIADELGDDVWAQGKCTNAKASCKEARERCTKCVEAEPKEPPGEGDGDPGKGATE